MEEPVISREMQKDWDEVRHWWFDKFMPEEGDRTTRKIREYYSLHSSLPNSMNARIRAANSFRKDFLRSLHSPEDAKYIDDKLIPMLDTFKKLRTFYREKAKMEADFDE